MINFSFHYLTHNFKFLRNSHSWVVIFQGPAGALDYRRSPRAGGPWAPGSPGGGHGSPRALPGPPGGSHGSPRALPGSSGGVPWVPKGPPWAPPPLGSHGTPPGPPLGSQGWQKLKN